MTRRRALLVLEVAAPAAVVAAWWFLSRNSQDPYFPPLASIVTAFRDEWLGDAFFSDALPSLGRMFAGFGIAAFFALPAGIVLGLLPRVHDAVTPVLEFLRAIPPPALIPFAIVVLGVGSGMKVFVIAVVCFFLVLLNVIDGVRSVEPGLLETAKAFQTTGKDRLLHVVLPAASPQIFAGLRVALALALILMVISEMVASTNGIGYFVLQSQRTFAISEMWSGILLLGILGYVLNLLFLTVERRVLAWHRAARSDTPI